jgi:putative hydrolase of the HAD superfamily
MPGLDVLLFDIDDTLCPTTAFAARARRNAVRGMIAAGLRADEDAVFAELEEVIAEFSSNYEHHFDKLLLRVDPQAVEGLNPALVVAAGVAAYHDTKFRELAPYPLVRELFAELHARGVRLGVITHGLTAKQAEKLVRLGLVPFIDPAAIFISDQIGVAKPNPKLYSTALKALEVAPERAMYIGDNPRNDIAPPKSLGMRTCWARMSERPAPPANSPELTADHEIRNFAELRALLHDVYGML